MDALDAFAIDLSKAIAPDAIDSAPAIARLVALGQSVRSSAAGPLFGGMDPVNAVESLFDPNGLLATAFHILKQDVSPLGGVCAVATHVLKGMGYLRQKISGSTDVPKPDLAPGGADVTEDVLSSSLEPVLDRVEAVLRSMQTRLEARGLDNARAGTLACSIVEVLVSQSDGGHAVLARLSGG
jgi:hypothetical protein